MTEFNASKKNSIEIVHYHLKASHTKEALQWISYRHEFSDMLLHAPQDRCGYSTHQSLLSFTWDDLLGLLSTKGPYKKNRSKNMSVEYFSCLIWPAGKSEDAVEKTNHCNNSVCSYHMPMLANVS